MEIKLQVKKEVKTQPLAKLPAVGLHLLGSLRVSKDLKNQKRFRRDFTFKKLARYFLVAASFVMVDLTIMPTSLRPASAQKSRCPSNRLCLFEHADFIGRYYSFRIGSRNFALLGDGSFNDQASSVYNNTPHSWCLAKHARYIAPMRIDPNTSINYIGDDFNDQISSVTRAEPDGVCLPLVGSP